MGPRPVGTPDPIVRVTYDGRNGYRQSRSFNNLTEARAFWLKKDREGRSPHYEKEPKI